MHSPYSVILCSTNSNEHDEVRIDIPFEVFKKIMYENEIDGILLSRLTLIDQGDVFEKDELLKIQSEINELIKEQVVTQQEMQELLKLLQFAIDNKRAVFFTPWDWGDIPLAKFEL